MVKLYDAIGKYIAEIYDQTETQREDVNLVRTLIGSRTLRILEPFCGHGRILIPLAEDGHQIVGLDLSEQLLNSARAKIRELSDDVRRRISLVQVDVTTSDWPTGFDLVILGANCLHELSTPGEQETCIKAAATALTASGYLYLDNEHLEGELDPGWYEPGVRENCFPTGICSDGTRVKGTREAVWYDVPQRLVRFRRTVEITTPGGKTKKEEWIKETRPPGTEEMRMWLEKHGFEIENLWGDRRQSPHTHQSGRAIFWAKLVDKK